MTSAERAGVQHQLANGRVAAFDWLRGLAVLVMIQTHSVVLLLPSLRAAPSFRRVDSIDGLVAPAFIFSAGFALALVTVRAAMLGRLKARLTESSKRALQVLGVASLVNAIWFPVFTQPIWLLRVDILHCIALSLFLALPVLAALASRPAVLRVVMLGLAMLIFAVAPLLENVTGPLQLLVTVKPGFIDAQTGATFPLFPWTAYLFLGASFGATAASMRRERELWLWWGLLMIIGGLAWWQSTLLLHAYPAHDFWLTNPADAARRCTQVLSLIAVLRVLERLFTTTPTVMRWLTTLGNASLPAYFFHEMWLFHHRIGFFTRLFRDSVGWPLYVVLLVALIALTWLSILAWRAAITSLGARLRSSS